MKLKRFLSYEWDAIAGIATAVAASILHLLHMLDEGIMMPIVLVLMALLFINFMRHTRNNELTAEQVARPGSALASRLPGPPVSTGSALPFHTVPRASVSNNCSPVAEDTVAASQAAGAKATRPISTPSNAPASAQRPAAPRVRCHANSASVDSAKPVRAKRAWRWRARERRAAVGAGVGRMDAGV